MKIFLAFCFVLFLGCLPRHSQTFVVTDYVPARDINIPWLPGIINAANQGDSHAQYQLGCLYYDGLGVPKSHKNALVLWTKAAVSGYLPAQYSLGVLYFEGIGIKNDFIEGCKWLNLAASQGSQEAIVARRRYYCGN